MSMAEANAYTVLLAPHKTEKTMMPAGQCSQYAFKVAKTATKPMIKDAFERIFEVTVQSVQIVNVKPKKKRFGRRLGTHSGWKKAYVVLAPGQEIELGGKG